MDLEENFTVNEMLMLEELEELEGLEGLEEYYKVFEEVMKAQNVFGVLVPILFGILLLIGLLGNSFVIYVTMTTKRLVKNPTHSMLVLNMAVSDIIYLLASGAYQTNSYNTTSWIYGSFFCPLLNFLTIQTMAVDIFTMCSLALMRFLAVQWPLRTHSSFLSPSGKRAGYLIIFIVWATASVLASPTAYYVRLDPFLNLSETNGTGSILCEWMGEDKPKYDVALLVLTYILPLLVVSFLYFCIARTIYILGRNLSRNTIQNNNNNTSIDPDDRERSEYTRTNALVLCLVVAFAVCWFPYHLCVVINMTVSDPSYILMKYILHMIGVCFSYAHSCLNPIVYTFAVIEYRRSLVRSIKCRKLRHRARDRLAPIRNRLIRSHWGYTSGRSSQETLKMNVFDESRIV